MFALLMVPASIPCVHVTTDGLVEIVKLQFVIISLQTILQCVLTVDLVLHPIPAPVILVIQELIVSCISVIILQAILRVYAMVMVVVQHQTYVLACLDTMIHSAPIIIVMISKEVYQTCVVAVVLVWDQILAIVSHDTWEHFVLHMLIVMAPQVTTQLPVVAMEYV